MTDLIATIAALKDLRAELPRLFSVYSNNDHWLKAIDEAVEGLEVRRSRGVQAALADLDTLEKAHEEIVHLYAQHREDEAALEEAGKVIGRFANAPQHGLHGGPLVQAVLTYEDGTDENTARHRGCIDSTALSLARDWRDKYGKQGQ